MTSKEGEMRMSHVQAVWLLKRSLTDYFSVLMLWAGLFIVSPLAFVGPSFGVCNGLHSACTTLDTTRWYWLGGYHALFGRQGADYPAVIKYWPTSVWEMWVSVLVSLTIAISLYIAVVAIISATKKHEVS